MGTSNRVATLVLAAGLCLPTAQDALRPNQTAPARLDPADTLEAYGAADRACREWTDGCATCLRRGNGTAGCSLPGIACQPTAVICRENAQNDTPSRSAPQEPK